MNKLCLKIIANIVVSEKLVLVKEESEFKLVLL